jgi:hypothetical protein
MEKGLGVQDEEDPEQRERTQRQEAMLRLLARHVLAEALGMMTAPEWEPAHPGLDVAGPAPRA